jgi:hypothetical protein
LLQCGSHVFQFTYMFVSLPVLIRLSGLILYVFASLDSSIHLNASLLVNCK